MFRYKITVEYDGAFFCGWQRQRSDSLVNTETESCLHSVQGTIEHALLKLTGTHVLVEGAGRTDAGVHALGQVAHFDLPSYIEPHRLLGGLNFYTRNHGCVVLDAEPVALDFHARFSATSREYIYKIINRRSPLALDKARAWHISRCVDVEAMRSSAQDFIGTHNFNAFRSSACQGKNPVKTLDSFEITEEQDTITCHVKARSFLHNQVRIMVGTLVWVGIGKYPQHVVDELLKCGNRVKSGPTAPPHGLYLAAVGYANYP